MSATAIGLAALGGGLGSALRYAVDTTVRARWTRSFPLATFAINVTGSLVLGILIGLAADPGRVSADVTVLLGTGLLGGYTTFSTASYETVRLVQAGERGTAVAYGLGSVIVTWLAAALGLAIAGLV